MKDMYEQVVNKLIDEEEKINRFYQLSDSILTIKR